MAQYPHCDSEVLHRPGDCIYCDMHPDMQLYRIENDINFTGERREGLAVCPSELRRPVETIYKWGGNIPMPPEEIEEWKKAEREYWEEVQRLFLEQRLEITHASNIDGHAAGWEMDLAGDQA